MCNVPVFIYQSISIVERKKPYIFFNICDIKYNLEYLNNLHLSKMAATLWRP